VINRITNCSKKFFGEEHKIQRIPKSDSELTTTLETKVTTESKNVGSKYIELSQQYHSSFLYNLGMIREMTELESVKREIEQTKADLKRARDAGQDIVPFIVYLAELQKKENLLTQGNPHFISPSIHQRILPPIMNDESLLMKRTLLCQFR
jgi:hypothetical protein